MERETFNLVVRKNLADAFEKWANGVPGKKGEKVDAALTALLALNSINRHLVTDLMRSDIDIPTAAQLIKTVIVDSQVRDFLGSLSDVEKAKVLADAKRHRDKPSRKK
jgi:hypothetical protein